MNTYKYFDNSQSVWTSPEKISTECDAMHGCYKSPVVFECQAEGILEADKLFEEALNTGIVLLIGEKKKPKTYNVTKLSHIGVSFEKLTF